ncbi:hypothetical protein H0A66_00590 [Alcaligenaceae bacterium]|nr:hypothetical protein [Alcaligenaceae bacterium]
MFMTHSPFSSTRRHRISLVAAPDHINQVYAALRAAAYDLGLHLTRWQESSTPAVGFAAQDKPVDNEARLLQAEFSTTDSLSTQFLQRVIRATNKIPMTSLKLELFHPTVSVGSTTQPALAPKTDNRKLNAIRRPPSQPLWAWLLSEPPCSSEAFDWSEEQSTSRSTEHSALFR